MRRYRLFIAMICICLGLQSCASPRLSQELERGKLSFDNGDFKQAFRQLLPLAVAGKCQAQYAIGYMYYYGYGVAEDQECGLFWMQKAADQGYRPAIKALDMIRTDDVPPPNPDQQATIGRTYKDSNIPVAPEGLMRSKPAKAPCIETPVQVSKAQTVYPTEMPPEPLPVVKPVKSKVIIKEKTTFTSMIVPKYTLQLLGSYHLRIVLDQQDQYKVRKETQVWHTLNHGKDWYILTYGQYDTAHAAAIGKKTLPKQLQIFKPWVRSLGNTPKLNLMSGLG